jgi:hypothetical protein
MDDGGNIYASKEFLDSLEKACVAGEGLHAATDDQIEAIRAKPGGASLTDDEARHLATLPRRQRRAALAELRRGRRP